MPDTGSIASRSGRDPVCLILAGLILVVAGCGRDTAPAEPALATLTGRAVLPADTFAAGPTVGRRLDSRINGRPLPFDSVPVQGFSSLIALGPDRLLALQDNGFGTLDNSPDYPLRWYELRVVLDDPPPAGGAVTVLGFVDLRDPLAVLPGALAHDDSLRNLTGADLDPESFVPLGDGSFWLGEEFGPSLVHVDATGAVIEKPVAIPIVPPLRAYARGSPVYRTPDHADLRHLRHEATRDELANQPRSGGVEGLAINPAGSRIYAAIEKGLRDDPVGARRVILEFDPAHRSFTGNYWLYLADGPEVSLASLEAVTDRVLVVLERDTTEGAQARIKRIYRIDLGRVDATGYVQKSLVCDLLNIDDPAKLTRRVRGAVGLGRHYRFPYVTPECLLVLDDSTLVVANDNNFPFSSGRRPPDTPDDTELIRLRLRHSLSPDPGPLAE